ncbi:MAG: cellulase family glycosylhydrolase, partial [Acidobacteriota bacterium]
EDPDDHFIFELHQYFDGNFSGTSPDCSPGHGAAQLEAVTGWLQTHGRLALLGEFAGANSEACRNAIEEVLAFMEEHPEQWIGWTWWAAGPECVQYIFTLEPTSNFTVDRPQMAWLEPYLGLFSDTFESGTTSRWSSTQP